MLQKKFNTLAGAILFTYILLALIRCTEPVKPDVDEPPVIQNNKDIHTYGSTPKDSLFGMYLEVTGTAPFTWYKGDLDLQKNRLHTLNPPWKA